MKQLTPDINLQNSLQVSRILESREFYKGKSFNYARDWHSGINYCNDQFVTDFVSYEGAFLACRKTHLSGYSNKPELIKDNNKIVGIKSDFWDLIFVADKPEKQQVLDFHIDFSDNEITDIDKFYNIVEALKNHKIVYITYSVDEQVYNLSHYTINDEYIIFYFICGSLRYKVTCNINTSVIEHIKEDNLPDHITQEKVIELLKRADDEKEVVFINDEPYVYVREVFMQPDTQYILNCAQCDIRLHLPYGLTNWGDIEVVVENAHSLAIEVAGGKYENGIYEEETVSWADSYEPVWSLPLLITFKMIPGRNKWLGFWTKYTE